MKLQLPTGNELGNKKLKVRVGVKTCAALADKGGQGPRFGKTFKREGLSKENISIREKHDYMR